MADLDLSIIYRLLLAVALGGAVGLERELRRKPAGLRTNIFICLGSALFTILSEEFGTRFGGDSGRIAAQLIPGIGFIGAGAILRERGSVVGLTTAATIFVVASVGMAVGTRMYLTAVFSCLLILTCLSFLGWAEDRFNLKTRLVTVRLTTSELETTMRGGQDALHALNIPIHHFQVQRVGHDFIVEFDVDVSHKQQRAVLEKLSAMEPRCEIVPLEGQRE